MVIWVINGTETLKDVFECKRNVNGVYKVSVLYKRYMFECHTGAVLQI